MIKVQFDLNDELLSKLIGALLLSGEFTMEEIDTSIKRLEQRQEPIVIDTKILQNGQFEKSKYFDMAVGLLAVTQDIREQEERESAS